MIRTTLITLSITLTACFGAITWPKDQALPWFSQPAASLDAVAVDQIDADERLTVSALQGLVNRVQPRVFLTQKRTEEGVDTWPESPTVRLGPRLPLSLEDLLKKYQKEVGGVVLYDPSPSSHYRNLAGTVAGIQKALPMTSQLHRRLQDQGIDFKILDNLTDLTASDPVEIYSHLYDTYWSACSRRLLFSMSPSTRRGHHHYVRDLAAATGSALIWLDCRIPEQRSLMQKFLGDLTPGNSLIMGWHPTERSGITTASEYGISTIPCDFFQNATVYAGGDHTIEIPAAPGCSPLEGKTYLTLFISDGDNIQYNQHAMRRVWDGQREHRGKIPLNWTIAPGLVDLAPGILNYYYGTATPMDCFVAGPSGMGYLMPSNTLREPGASVGHVLSSADRMKAFAQLTDRYLGRSGLRVLTVWDQASQMHRAAYEKHCKNLLGVTVQNFRDVPSVAGSFENKRLPFEKLVLPYVTTAEHLNRSLSEELAKKKPGSPLFLAYQVNIWKELKPDRLTRLVLDLKKQQGEQLQIVRADHYFELLKKSKLQPRQHSHEQ